MLSRRHLAFLLLMLFLSACGSRPNTAPEPTANLGSWSPATDGLQSRIETYSHGFYLGDAVYVLIKNASRHPISLADPNAGEHWQLQFEYAGTWHTRPVDAGQTAIPPETSPAGREAESPPVLLDPNQTALLEFPVTATAVFAQARRVRILLTRGWCGVITADPLQTPPFLVRHAQISPSVEGNENCPEFLPPFAQPRGLDMVLGNRSGQESALDDLHALNGGLIEQLRAYRPDQVAHALEQKFAAENDFAMKLLYADQAAARGSAIGREFILHSLHTDDYDKLRCALDALKFQFAQSDWAIDAMIAALNDQRIIRNIPHWASGTTFTVSQIAQESGLPWTLADPKCKRAVPTLINLLPSDPRGAIYALGHIGDQRAIPVLADFVNHFTKTKTPDIYGFDDYSDAMEALVQLKMPHIVEFLLAHEPTRKTVELLEDLGDPRAIPALQKIAKTVFALTNSATLALATLEPGDHTTRYIAILQNQNLDKFARADAADRLRAHVDPRAIPALLQAATEEPSGAVIDHAISALGEYHYKRAVDALIALFSADFTNKHGSKFPYTPDQFRECIVRSLEPLTGESYGADAATWQKWWSSARPTSPLPE